MLAEDVRLDVVSRKQRSGRGGVEKYFTYYAETATWHVVPAWLEGREILVAYLHEEDVRPHHVVLVTGDGGHVKHIRDYMYVEYLVAEARFVHSSILNPTIHTSHTESRVSNCFHVGECHS